MNLQAPLSNVYLIVIPKNFTNDIHICGRCKVQYTLLSTFLEHKSTCGSKSGDDSECKPDTGQDSFKKIEIENLMEINELNSFEDSEKDSNQVVILNSLLSRNANSLKQFKVDVIEGNAVCINESELCINQGSDLLDQKEAVDYKRTLQNDEEDIAALLANQLSSETADAEGSVELQLQDSLGDQDQSKEQEDKEDNTVLYRGKIRKLFTCTIDGCTYKTLLRKDIERHTRVHTGERPFKCYLCLKAFTRADKLLLHQRIHAGDKRYKCTKCDYASVDSGSLIKHLRVHSGDRPFKCQLCAYRARDSSQLTVHLRKHTGDSPFVCTNDKCKSAFKTNSDLKRHMVVHSGEKPHSCLYCPYKCTLKRNLQIHVQSQHPNGELKDYKCHLCPRFTLPTIRRLKNHMKKYHGDAEVQLGSQSGVNFTDLGENVVGKQIKYEKRRRKGRRSNDKIAIGVMNKAFDCKLCDASFVCQDSLLTHVRYHTKVDEERKSENKRDEKELPNDSAKRTRFGKPVVEEEDEKRLENFGENLVISDSYIVDNGSFTESLRNAEILASLNPVHTSGGVRQYVMTVQNGFTAEEFVLAQN